MLKLLRVGYNGARDYEQFCKCQNLAVANFIFCLIILPCLQSLSSKFTFSHSIMSRVCQFNGTRPQSGNNVSHANNKTRRRFLPNLHWHRLWSPGENRYVRLRLSNRALRTIDKIGVDAAIKKMRAEGVKC